MKENYPHYIGDNDIEEKERIITEEYLKYDQPVFISNDGDAHDSR